jgi:hypothetical protein
MAGNRITFELGGLPTEDGYIQLADFLGALQQFKSALNQADHVASNGKSTKIRVVELSMSSPGRVSVELIPFDATDDHISEITNAFFAASRGKLDPSKSEAARSLVGALENLASMVGKSLARASFQNGSEQVALGQEFRLKGTPSVDGERTVSGTIRGRLEFLNVHAGANNFRIYPVVGPRRRVVCKFTADNEDKALRAVKKTIAVTGLLYYKEGAYFPHTIDVTEIEILSPDSQLPKLSDLRGIAPDITGGMKSEEYVRKLRDAWHTD